MHTTKGDLLEPLQIEIFHKVSGSASDTAYVDYRN